MLNYHVHLTTFPYGSNHAECTRKSQLELTEDKSHEKERFVWMEINFVLGKNGGHTPNSLGGRLIVMVRYACMHQAGREADR